MLKASTCNLQSVKKLDQSPDNTQYVMQTEVTSLVSVKVILDTY